VTIPKRGLKSGLYFSPDGSAILDYLTRGEWGFPPGAFSRLFDAASGQELPLAKYGPNEQCLTELDPVNPLMVIIFPRPKYKSVQTKVKKKVGFDEEVEVLEFRQLLDVPGPFTLRVIDPFRGKEIGAVVGLKEVPEVGQASLSRDGKRLALIRADGSVAVCDTQAGTVTQSWVPKWKDAPLDLRTVRLLLSPDGGSVAMYWAKGSGFSFVEGGPPR